MMALQSPLSYLQLPLPHRQASQTAHQLRLAGYKKVSRCRIHSQAQRSWCERSFSRPVPPPPQSSSHLSQQPQGLGALTVFCVFVRGRGVHLELPQQQRVLPQGFGVEPP